MGPTDPQEGSASGPEVRGDRSTLGPVGREGVEGDSGIKTDGTDWSWWSVVPVTAENLCPSVSEALCVRSSPNVAHPPPRPKRHVPPTRDPVRGRCLDSVGNKDWW